MSVPQEAGGGNLSKQSFRYYRSVGRARLVVTSHTPLNIRITAMPFISVKLSMPRVMPTMVATMGWR